MKIINTLLIAPLLITALSATGFAHGTGQAHQHHDNQPGIQAANAWITLVDSAQYKKSWESAAQLFKTAVTPDQWAKTVKSVRGPLGNLLERNLFHDQYTTTLPGLPDGEYLVLRYIAKYENKKSAVETVTVIRDQAGNWRVGGYFIK